MTQTSTMTLRLDKATLKRLDALAEATDRSRAWLAGRAVEEYVATQAWQVQAIREAVAEADRYDAEFLEQDDVRKRVLATGRLPRGRAARTRRP